MIFVNREVLQPCAEFLYTAFCPSEYCVCIRYSMRRQGQPPTQPGRRQIMRVWGPKVSLPSAYGYSELNWTLLSTRLLLYK